MFAGIGGFRAGLDRAGGFRCIGHCEIDRHAHQSYCAIHHPGKEECYYPDARAIDPNQLPRFDLLCGGFPCQSFSQAGKRQGFADARDTLFFEIARLAEARRPAYLLLENVPGLLSHDQGRTFAAILTTLSDLGYCCEWMVLNSADFGVPQSRRRVFLIGYLDPRCAGKVFPVFGTAGKALVQILRGPQGSRVYDPGGVACTQTAGAGGMGGKTGLYFIDLCKGAPTVTETARCITAGYGKTGLSNHKREKSGVLLIKEGTKTWKLMSDASIRGERKCGSRYLPEDSRPYKVELVTPKLTYDELSKFQECIRQVRHAGAKVNDSCGLHVHVDASNHNRQSLKNLISIMYSKEDILFKALQVNEARASRWCKKVREPMLKEARKLSSDTTKDLTQLESIWYEGNNGSDEHYNWSRYYALNLHARPAHQNKVGCTWVEIKIDPGYMPVMAPRSLPVLLPISPGGEDECGETQQIIS